MTPYLISFRQVLPFVESYLDNNYLFTAEKQPPILSNERLLKIHIHLYKLLFTHDDLVRVQIRRNVLLVVEEFRPARIRGCRASVLHPCDFRRTEVAADAKLLPRILTFVGNDARILTPEKEDVPLLEAAAEWILCTFKAGR